MKPAVLQRNYCSSSLSLSLSLFITFFLFLLALPIYPLLSNDLLLLAFAVIWHFCWSHNLFLLLQWLWWKTHSHSLTNTGTHTYNRYHSMYHTPSNTPWHADFMNLEKTSIGVYSVLLAVRYTPNCPIHGPPHRKPWHVRYYWTYRDSLFNILHTFLLCFSLSCLSVL